MIQTNPIQLNIGNKKKKTVEPLFTWLPIGIKSFYLLKTCKSYGLEEFCINFVVKEYEFELEKKIFWEMECAKVSSFHVSIEIRLQFWMGTKEIKSFQLKVNYNWMNLSVFPFFPLVLKSENGMVAIVSSQIGGKRTSVKLRIFFFVGQNQIQFEWTMHVKRTQPTKFR